MLPSAKHYIAIVPISATNGATAGGTNDLPIDTLGYDFMSVTVFASTANVVSNTLSVLQLKEADTTATTQTAISGAVGGTDFTIATNAYTSSSNQNIWTFNVDLRGRKRYIRCFASPQTTMVMAGLASLYRGEQAPITATKANVLNVVNL